MGSSDRGRRLSPLAILNWCGSNLPDILPTIARSARSDRSGESFKPKLCDATEATRPRKDSPEPQNVWNYVPESINQNSGISPSLLWGIITGFILIACVAHIVFLWSADLWSPFTRDLAIDHNDLPHRRSVHLNIGTSVLVAMAFVSSFPLILVGRFFPLATAGHVLAWATIVVACVAGLLTIIKSWRYCYHPRCPEYTFFNAGRRGSYDYDPVLDWLVHEQQPGWHPQLRGALLQLSVSSAVERRVSPAADSSAALCVVSVVDLSDGPAAFL